MMKIKKFVALLLALMMTFAVSVPSFAEAEEDYGIMPCYVRVMSCGAALVREGNDLDSTAHVTLEEESKIKIFLQLRRSTTGEENSFSTYSPNVTFNKVGQAAVVGNLFEDVPSGYYYQVKATMKIYDVDTDAYVETVYAESQIRYVP